MKRDLLARGIPPETGRRLAPWKQGHGGTRPWPRAGAGWAFPTDAKVVLFFGFIWLGKGIDFLLERIRTGVATRVPEAFSVRRGPHPAAEVFGLRFLSQGARLVAGLRRAVRVSGAGSCPRTWFPSCYSAGDVVAMPYRQDYSSVSGVVHQTCRHRQADALLAHFEIRRGQESIDPALTVPPDDVDAWTETLVRLLTDEAWAAEMKQKIKRFAEATSWSNVGKMHLDAYAKLLGRDVDHAHSRQSAVARQLLGRWLRCLALL
jgi:hypothetical protein